MKTSLALTCRYTTIAKITLVLCFLCAWVPLNSQSLNSELTGIVTDQHGAAIQGAKVTITNAASGVEVLTDTNQAGSYHVGNLTPGTYVCKVTHPGFDTFVRQNFLLSAGDIGRLDVTLAVGTVEQEVNVTGQAPLLQTQSAQVSDLIDSRDIEELPSLSRKYTELITLNALTSNVSQSNWQNDSVLTAGGTGNDTAIYFNGGASNDPATGDTLTGVHQEFVQEFQENVNSFSAEFGTQQSFSIATKSGTNQFHGEANFFAQDTAWNATPWGATTSTPFQTRDIGFNIGGPIRKNKLHFFFGYQHLHYNTSFPIILTVPTAAERSGDFSQYVNSQGAQIPIYDPSTTQQVGPGQYTRSQFQGNMIPSNEIDPVGKAILNTYPLPNRPGTAGGANNFAGLNTTLEDRPQYYLRLDQQWNQKHSTFFNFNYSKDTSIFPSVYGVPGFSDNANASSIPTQKFLWDIGHVFIPSPSWVLETTWTWNWLRFDEFDQATTSKLGYAAKLGLTNAVDPNYFPTLSVSGYSNGGGTISQLVMPFGSYDLTERVTHDVGKHTIKFGVDWIRSSQQQLNDGDEALNFGLQPTADPLTGVGGNGAASLLLGFPMSASISEAFWRRTTQGLSGYVQDSWRLLNNLTLTAGLRIDTTFPAYIHNPITDQMVVQGFDATAINPVSNTPGIMTYPGAGHPLGAFQTTVGYGPRIGVAWQPWGTGSKTVIRAGWGLYPGNITGVGTFTIFGGCSCATQGNFVSPDNGITAPFYLRNGLPAAAQGQINPATGVAQVGGAGFGAVPVGTSPVYAPAYAPYNLPLWHSNQYNLTVERELPYQTNLEVSFIGNWATHVPGFMTQDQVPLNLMGPGNAQLLRPFPQYANVTNYEDPVFWGHYSAFRAHAEKRSSSNLTFNIDYVWDKNIANYSAWNAYDISGGGAIQEPEHRFVAYAIYGLPWGRGQKWLTTGVWGNVLGNWTFTPIIRWQSGSWLDVNNATDTSNAFENGNQGVNLVAGQSPNSGPKTMAEWFNVGAFTAPAPYTFGNAGRTSVLGPQSTDFDASLSKVFTLPGERVKAQLKLEAFNLLNHPNLENPSTTFGAPGFGVIGAKSGNRQLQIGIRVYF